MTLRGVSDEIPVVTRPLSSVDGWDDSLALEVGTSQDVEAQGAGARIVSSDEDDNGDPDDRGSGQRRGEADQPRR